MSNIKVVSNRTIVKKIVIGTPIPTTKNVSITTTVDKILDVNLGTQLKTGDVLVYNDNSKNWDAQNVLNLQVIDGGEGF